MRILIVLEFLPGDTRELRVCSISLSTESEQHISQWSWSYFEVISEGFESSKYHTANEREEFGSMYLNSTRVSSR